MRMFNVIFYWSEFLKFCQHFVVDKSCKNFVSIQTCKCQPSFLCQLFRSFLESLLVTMGIISHLGLKILQYSVPLSFWILFTRFGYHPHPLRTQRQNVSLFWNNAWVKTRWYFFGRKSWINPSFIYPIPVYTITNLEMAYLNPVLWTARFQYTVVWVTINLET